METSDPNVEEKRLAELYSLNALQTEPDAVLDAFCEKVAKLFNVPSCIVSLVFEDKQWFKSNFGCPDDLARVRETPRDISFCTHVVDTQQPLIVRDVSKDPRFSHNPLVKKYGFGFYAGFPLTTSRGYVLGSLCLYDTRPRVFTDREMQLLGLFSERVIAHLELYRELQRTRVSEARFRSIAESAHDGLVVMGEDGKIMDVNPALERMFGSRKEALVGQCAEVLLPERYRQQYREVLTEFIEKGATDKWGQSLQLEALRHDGTEFPVEVSISGFMSDGRWTFTAFIRDITQRKHAEETLAEQAIRDTLTNLFNRRHFNYRIEEEIARADRTQKSLAILLCDLDDFKAVNDLHGHHMGDEVLKAVAKGIQESTRGTDLVFRWGGDEVVVVLPDTDREGVLTAADRMRRAVYRVGQQMKVDLDLSIGVAIYPEHGRNVDELIRLSDRALYIAKKGGDKIHIGEEEYRLDENTVKVVFQSVVNIRTQQILGYEALSRDAQGKLSILDLFKKYSAIGQLNELKCLCFRMQLKAARELRLQRVFINVDFNVLEHLERMEKPDGMDVILEISELAALHNVEGHLRLARRWREFGYKFAIDDFGAGFISFPFIAQLVPDYIKVDRSTILQAVGSEKFRKFTKGLVQALGNYTGEGIIAEGVETEKELQIVKDTGIYLVQGYLLGRPQEFSLRS